MDESITQKINQLEEKVEKIYISVEKTRKYFMWTMIITLVVFILPLLALVFIVPSFMTNYIGQIQTLSQ